MSKGICLNVNIPKKKSGKKLRGIKLCCQANANWKEEFQERKDPSGRTYYWLTGDFVNYDDRKNTDEWALENHFISIVPVQFDLTAYNAIPNLKNILNE